MIEKFNLFITENKLLNKSDTILLAISGGADSVAMLDLFSQNNYNVAVAHCNFQLRAEESDADLCFVHDLAVQYGFQFYSKIFNTRSYASQRSISIEMAARELRYKWFDELSKTHSYNKIATAHHSNDSVETILLNMTRQTGINGLLGIPKENKKIIRPLLFASKIEILDYCSQNNLKYRTDKTNFKTDYQRNKVRNIIIPEFQKINSAFNRNILKTAENLSYYKEFFDFYLRKFIDKCIIIDRETIFINKKTAKEHSFLYLFMFEYLRKFNFNSEQTKNILKIIDNQSGKLFYSKTHRLIIERNFLTINKIDEACDDVFEINKNDKNIIINKNKIDELHLELIRTKNTDNIIEKNRFIAFFDLEKLVFPLIIRKWEHGDFFRPFGMSGKIKKISDFFKDKKMTKIQKENVWILKSNNNIIWIIGHRTDDICKITHQTKNVLIIKNHANK